MAQAETDGRTAAPHHDHRPRALDWQLGGLILLLAGCASTGEAMRSWEGRSESELVSAWGAPAASIDTRDGQRVLTWETYWGQFGQRVCRKSFTVDPRGIVVRWAFEGCPY